MTTAPDGSQAALIIESSPSSLATIITVPNVNEPLLVMDLKWIGGLNPSEFATFTVDFTGVNQVTTQLFQTQADNPLLHGDQLQSLMVPIPASLRGQKGVIRFRLDPSSSDGVISQVMLGGFGVFEIPTDTTAPTTTASLAGTLGNGGWYVGPVSVTLSSTDDASGSGVAATRYSVNGGALRDYAGPFMVPGDGKHTIDFFSIDNAGNVEATRTVTFMIDQTAPLITATTDRETLWPPNGKMIPITITGRISDATSGLDPATLRFAVTDEYGLVQPNGTITVDANGNYTITILLEASRKGTDEDGRLYTILISASDLAGNSKSASVDVVVSHDQRGGSGVATSVAATPASGVNLSSSTPSIVTVPFDLAVPAGPLALIGGGTTRKRLQQVRVLLSN